MSQRFVYGVIAGALLGWWLNRRAQPRPLGPYENRHTKYSGLNRFR